MERSLLGAGNGADVDVVTYYGRGHEDECFRTFGDFRWNDDQADTLYTSVYLHKCSKAMQIVASKAVVHPSMIYSGCCDDHPTFGCWRSVLARFQRLGFLSHLFCGVKR